MKTLAFVLAGGEGRRLHPLTARHAKPALPFVNGYRFIDFVLSNLLNSGICAIYVITQYKPQSLIDHLRSAWIKRFKGKEDDFLMVVRSGANGADAYCNGTADAVYKNRQLIAQHAPDVVAVFAADQVYRMDIRQMVDFHRGREADVTVAAVPVPIELASSFGVIVTGHNAEICEFQEKPAQPAPIATEPTCAYASMGNYLFKTEVLSRLLEEANRAGGTDFGHHILPRLPGRYRTFAYDFRNNVLPGVAPHEEQGYWRDVGTIEALVAAKDDTFGPQPRFELENPDWPIFGRESPIETVKWSAVLSKSSVQEHAAAR